MTITLDIKPEVQAELARQSAIHGQTVEVIAAALLEDAVHPAPAPAKAPAKDLVELFEPIRGLLTDEEVDRLFSRNPSPARPVDLG